MFRRKKVHPLVDDYIKCRYEDIAVSINADLRSEKGLQNHYILWLESKLQGFPEAQRKKYSLLRDTPQQIASAFIEEAGPSNTTAGKTGKRVTFQETDSNPVASSEQPPPDITWNSGEIHSKFCTIL